jgi:hypothetical protein
MIAWRGILYLGWLLIGVVLYLLQKRDKQAALRNESYISPLNGMIEHVPPVLQAQRYLLWAVIAGTIAAVGSLRKDYLVALLYTPNIVAALYSAWVYRRGREPKIMEGFRELPDPPSLFRPR